MKVYFVAAHSVGKSTLTRYVSKKYNLPMIFESARIVLSEQELHIDSLRADLDNANNYQNNVFERQLQEEAKYDSFISDRSIIDVLAYTAQHTSILPKLLQHPSLPTYIDKLKSSDVKIFFVRPSKATLKADGIRESLSWDGIISIDSKIHFMLEMYGLNYFQINTDSMQERIKLIDSVLQLY